MSSASDPPRGRAIALPLPRSLLAPKHAAPLVTSIASAIVVAEAALADRTDPLAWTLAVVGVPAVSATVVVSLFARSASPGSSVAKTLAIATVLMLPPFALVGLVVAPGPFALVVGLVTSVVATIAMLVVCAPVLVAARIYGRRASRGDWEAGDAMLGFGAAWLAVGQLLLTVPLPIAPGWLSVPALVAGAAVAALALARGVRRRAWCARVARGELPGFRLRPFEPNGEAASLGALPVVMGPRGAAEAIVEAAALEAPADAYRDARVAVPIALAPARYLTRATLTRTPRSP